VKIFMRVGVTGNDILYKQVCRLFQGITISYKRFNQYDSICNYIIQSWSAPPILTISCRCTRFHLVVRIKSEKQ